MSGGSERGTATAETPLSARIRGPLAGGRFLAPLGLFVMVLCLDAVLYWTADRPIPDRDWGLTFWGTYLLVRAWRTEKALREIADHLEARGL